jgi:hypothetical protein
MAGFCDDRQTWCLALALWNGQDPILKERMFGLNGPEGNHGEDVKEYWWYLDATPTHSWNSWRYHYPQREFPYHELVATNRSRGRHEPEYELLDTGAFGQDRFWVVEVVYAKADPEDLLMLVRVTNQGPEQATIHVLPTLWFRNTWAWGLPGQDAVPSIRAGDGCLTARHHDTDTLTLSYDGAPTPLFCDNETNADRLWGAPNRSPFPKDANQRLRHQRPGHYQSGAARHEGRAALRLHRPCWFDDGDPGAPRRQRHARRDRRRLRGLPRRPARGGGRVLRHAVSRGHNRR